MPRKARNIAASGVYHVMVRGIDKQQIFADDADNIMYLYLLDSVQNDDFRVLGYCLMGSHAHLLIKTTKGSGTVLESAMKSLGIRYVNYYNARYKRLGPLFQGRFKSEAVETKNYFLNVLRYIHRNPLTAGICADYADYPWCSYIDYFGPKRKPLCRVDTDAALMLGSRSWLLHWHQLPDESKYLDIDIDKEEAPRLTDAEARALIVSVAGCSNVEQFRALPADTRDAALMRLATFGIGQRQLSRLTGISRGVIIRANNNL